jgi:hypothetical protein
MLGGDRAPCASNASRDVVVGILESLSPEQMKSLQRDYGYRVPAVVRVAFKKESGQWRAFRSGFDDPDQLRAAPGLFPSPMEWTVASGGGPRGRIESASPPQWTTYGDVGIQLISPGRSIPRIGRPDSAFEQWGSSGPVYQPLIVVSQPNTRDPEGWRRISADGSPSKLAVADFRARIVKENPASKFDISRVTVLKAYRSRSGAVLLAIALAGTLPADEVPGTEWSPHWFVVGPSGVHRFLGSGLMLIDAGDYGNDGRNEVVFAESGYDRDGYIMFLDGFSRSVEFAWNYH